METERQARRYKIWERARQLTPTETQAVAKLQGLLERGIQVCVSVFFLVVMQFCVMNGVVLSLSGY